jgi:hypothetical protein
VTSKIRLTVNHAGAKKRDRIVPLVKPPAKHPAKPKVKPRGRSR